MNTDYCIRGGEVLEGNQFRKADVLIRRGVIESIAPKLTVSDCVDIDARGMLVVPGFVDIHCHLREPGFEYKEDIASGSAAAVKGGFTTVCCMANTKPVNDNVETTRFIQTQAEKAGLASVRPIAAVTMGQNGQALSDFAALRSAGAVAFSDDGRSVKDASLMRDALRAARELNACIISHPEDEDLAAGGLINEGARSAALGIAGKTRLAEETIIARDAMIGAYEGAHIHIAHVSTAGGAEIVREIKKRGGRVTCETAPHYLCADDSCVKLDDASSKVNPPLRTKADSAALIAAIQDGTIDCIATDHAPHHVDDKHVSYEKAAMGISGFETAFALCWTKLVVEGHISREKLFCLLSAAPAGILGLENSGHALGLLEAGAAADICIVDPNAYWVIDPAAFVSKGKNSPFGGRSVQGRVCYTFASGKLVYKALP